MTPLAQRIAIAKAVGWTRITQNRSDGLWYGQIPNAEEFDSQGALENLYLLPNYLSDLNAMRSAELWLESQSLDDDYLMELGDLTGGNTVIEHWFETWTGRTKVAFAPCSICAEAFLRTLSLWEDSVPEPIKS